MPCIHENVAKSKTEVHYITNDILALELAKKDPKSTTALEAADAIDSIERLTLLLHVAPRGLGYSRIDEDAINASE